jgi:hypothetical protein
LVAVEGRATPTYTTRIIKAGALLTDTRTLFTHWDTGLSRSENLEQLRAANVFGKGSRSRVEDVLSILRQRYLTAPGIADALATLVQTRVPSSVLTPIFYFHSAQNDELLHDVVIDFLAPQQWHGRAEITTEQLVRFLLDQVRVGRTASGWSEATTRRVAQGLLAALRDFGVLAGTVKSPKKHLAPMYLPIEAFVHIAFVLNQRLRSGDRLVSSDEWRLFFLAPQLVERFFIEAEQERLLTYNAAGRVVRVDFPADSIENYARVVAQRSY